MEITVHLGKRSYPIYLENKALSTFPFCLKEYFPESRFVCVTNGTLAALYRDVLSVWEKELSFSTFTIPDGEKYKTVETWHSVIDFLLSRNLDRKSVVCAFGGGVVGDIVGFAAAAFLRGVSYVQVPTTLLAMVDSSVGGKTGVNHPMGKNLIGAFHQPSMVWMDTSFLESLPQREFVAGYAELFKYAFIGGGDMFNFVNDTHERMFAKEKSALLSGIKRSIEVKARIVENDEREESGRRALLNFGHTFAHALERFFNFEGLLHGEAVLWGVRCACDLGIRLGIVPPAAIGQYLSLLEKLPPAPLPSRPDAGSLYTAMFTDKKMRGGRLTFVLPREPGVAILSRDVPRQSVVETLTAVMEAGTKVA
jgi:3-dehydroquinate synthase